MGAYLEISLTRGQIAKVSSERYVELSRFKWTALWSEGMRGFYAVRANRYGFIYMHREILGLSAGDKRYVDHVNGDTLDNQDFNLRLATASQNGWNSKISINNTSGIKGVSWDKNKQRWAAYLRKDRKTIHLGSYALLEDAARARHSAAQSICGEFAREG